MEQLDGSGARGHISAMGRLGSFIDRWLEGALIFVIAALVFVTAFVMVCVPIYALKALGLIDPANWVYWGAAALLSPYLAAIRPYRGVWGMQKRSKR